APGYGGPPAAKDETVGHPCPFFAIQSPTCDVPRLPPMSVVVCPSRTAASTAASIVRASSRQPSVSSISAAERIEPIGFAMFLPAIGGADPCTGSKSDVLPG